MNDKQLLVFIAFLATTALILSNQDNSKLSQFETWKAKHGVSFHNQFENAYRERIFLANLAAI